jgi:hypothetical protein
VKVAVSGKKRGILVFGRGIFIFGIGFALEAGVDVMNEWVRNDWKD